MTSFKIFSHLWRFQSIHLFKQRNHFSKVQNYHYDLVAATDENGIRQITLNNPMQRNILSEAVLESLKFNLENGINKEGGGVHCIIIKAVGKVFSAGHDLKELTSDSKEKHLRVFKLCAKVMLAIQHLPVPVIAQVNGLATAAGCQLAASCDIVIAGESAKFSTPGVNVGLFCSTPGIALVRAVPKKLAAYMLYTGLPITAKEASQSGLVSRVVPDDRLEEETMKIARIISQKSKPVQALGKEFLIHQSDLSTRSAYEMGSVVMTNNLALKDTQSGIKAFAEKKKPIWTHTVDKAH